MILVNKTDSAQSYIYSNCQNLDGLCFRVIKLSYLVDL